MTYSRDALPESMPEKLFHYTTAAGLLGILRGQNLWATDLRFLNDSQEQVFARDLLIKSVQEMKNPVLDAGHPAHKFGQPAARSFDAYRGFALEALTLRPPAVYVACFCEEGDLLGQWRGYGSDHGYAIELETQILDASLNELATYPSARGLAPVRYGLNNASSVVSKAIQKVSEFDLNHPGAKAEYTAHQFAALLATVKHPGFSEEREWRLYAAFDRVRQEVDTDQIPGYPRVKFRTSPMAIIPYIEVRVPVDAVVSVRVGPGSLSEVRESGVRTLLASLGSKAEVLRSEVPLRA